MFEFDVAEFDGRSFVRDFRKGVDKGLKEILKDLQTTHTQAILSGKTPRDVNQKRGKDPDNLPLFETGRLARKTKIVRAGRHEYTLEPPDDRKQALERLHKLGYITIFNQFPRRQNDRNQQTMDDSLSELDARDYTKQVKI